jgi:hypothetical protein
MRIASAMPRRKCVFEEESQNSLKSLPPMAFLCRQAVGPKATSSGNTRAFLRRFSLPNWLTGNFATKGKPSAIWKVASGFVFYDGIGLA